MYNQEIVQRLITSPFTSNLDEKLVEAELIDGFKAGVRAQICSPGQFELAVRLRDKYGSGKTRIGMVIGYPYGGMTTAMKCCLMQDAVDAGLDEVDLVFNVTAAASLDFDTVREEVRTITERFGGKIRIVAMLWMVKFNFEIVDELCRIYEEFGIDSVKTSAGIHFGEMQLEHIQWLHRCHPGLCIEVAGKVRQREKAEAMFAAGASYIHTGSWRKLSGIGTDPTYCFDTKECTKGEFFRNMMEGQT